MATAKELAGDKNVAVNGGQMARQCLEAGLLDEVGARPVQLEGPIAVVEAPASRTALPGQEVDLWRPGCRTGGPGRQGRYAARPARGNVRPAMGNRTNRVVVRSLAEFCLALDAALAVAIVMVLR